MQKSIQFYQEVLGMEVIADFGANVTLTGGIALQTIDTWKDFIQKQKNQIAFGNHAMELYFEEDDMDSFIKKLEGMPNITYVHRVKEQPWGQRVVRFYDLDQHIIEVGENMAFVVKRFFDSGLSVEETASHMDVPIEFVQSCLGSNI